MPSASRLRKTIAFTDNDMRLHVSHLTTYQYDKPVHYALQQVRLTPPSQESQRVVTWNLTVEGGRKQLEFEDQHHNRVTLISIEEEQSVISIRCTGEVETTNQNGIVGHQHGYAPLWYFKRPTALTRPGPRTHALVKSLGGDAHDDVTRLHALSRLVANTVSYEKGKTGTGTTAEDALRAGYGVCQDHAHVFVTAARLLGFPARYVSGYLMMKTAVEQDASHSWAEAWIANVGWTGFDVSNGISPDEHYVRVATGLDYRDAAPTSGIRIGDAQESLTVAVRVEQ